MELRVSPEPDTHPRPTSEDNPASSHIIGRHSVRVSDDLEVTVAEDEPKVGDVEAGLAKIDTSTSSRASKYFLKWRGDIDKEFPFPSLEDVGITWIGAFLGILVVSVSDYFLWHEKGFQLLVASFGASAVLIYGAPESRLAQPRNLIGGHVISAVVGVCIRLALDKVQWLANAVGMSLALLAMQLTGTVHPPGGATALIACSAPVMFPWHGFQLVVAVMLGAVELLLVGLVVNNFHRKRAYPTFWW
eukprot:gene8660-8841_t